MIETPWEGNTVAPDDYRNQTPAWMCLTREGLDQKERREKKNEREARRKPRKRPVQLMLVFDTL